MKKPQQLKNILKNVEKVRKDNFITPQTKLSRKGLKEFEEYISLKENSDKFGIAVIKNKNYW